MPSSVFAQARGLREVADDRQRGVEELAGQLAASARRRTADDRAERPRARPWLSSEPRLVEPVREYDRKFRKRPRGRLERGVDEGEVARRQRAHDVAVSSVPASSMRAISSSARALSSRQ